MNWDLIVIGGGAAGMIAAGTAAENGKKVLLIERNEKLGKKIYITGKGRCNLTNAADLDVVMKNIIRNPKFLYSAFHAFSNKDVMEFFENLGIRLKIERGQRVFPASDKSHDVIRALEKYIKKNNVTVYLNQRVKDVLTEKDRVAGVEIFSGQKYYAPKVILATGGISYPQTGSTGDGYKISEKLSHEIIAPEPSLIPIETKENWAKELQGVSLKNVALNLFENEKLKHSEFGEMIFTHFGISGPIVLSTSYFVKECMKNKTVFYLSLDLKPALKTETIDRRIQRDFEKYSRKQFKNSLDDLFPQKLIPIIIRFSKIDGEKTVNQITKEERLNLCNLIKNLKMTVKCLRPVEEAIITSGGVSVKDINSSTMESKKIKGLFFAGEIIDVEGYTGGFNLQIAFSTGYLAGKSV